VPKLVAASASGSKMIDEKRMTANKIEENIVLAADIHFNLYHDYPIVIVQVTVS
jgi:hypothetical protein